MDNTVSDITVDYSVAALSEKTFEQLALFWSARLVPELIKIDHRVDWPLISVRADVDTDEFLAASSNFKKVAAAREEIQRRRRSASLFVQKELYISDRLEIMSDVLIDTMKHVVKTMNLLLSAQSKLFARKFNLIENLQATLPSPRTFKRRPKVTPDSEVARDLTRLHFELFLVDDKMHAMAEETEKYVVQAHQVIDLMSYSRQRVEKSFIDRYSKEEKDDDIVINKIHILDTILRNVSFVLQMKANA